MKTLSINRLTGVVLSLCLAGAALAHEGSGTLGPSPTATDYLVVTCEDDGSGTPDYLLFQLKVGPPANGPTVSAQIQVPDKQIAYNVTDAVNGNLDGSREVEVKGGGALYHVTVNKSGAGNVSYFYTYHCETANGIHTGTVANTRQNQ